MKRNCLECYNSQLCFVACRAKRVLACRCNRPVKVCDNYFADPFRLKAREAKWTFKKGKR